MSVECSAGWRQLPLLELGALLAVALAALAFQLTLPSRLPAPDEDAAIAAALERELQAGDAVVLWPWWTERARVFLPERARLYGYLGVEGDDLRAHPRVWVLSQPGLPRAEMGRFEESFLPGRARRGEVRTFGHYALALYENGRHRPARFSAVDSVASARAYLEAPSGERRACPFDGRAHRCGGPPHLYIAPEWHEVRFEPRRCLWMHPAGGKIRLVAEYDAVPAGTALRMEAGIIFEHAFSKAPHLRTVHLGVDDRDSGEALLRLDLPPGLEGIQRVERALGEGPPRNLKLWVQADSAESRQVCVDVLALEGALR